MLRTTSIAFPVDRHAWDSDAYAMIFPAIVDGNKLKCLVSREALEDHFGANGSNYEAKFLENRLAIERVARNKIHHGEFQADGNILVSTLDF